MANDIFDDTTNLPKTRRSEIPYEMEALSPRETWGAGNNNSTFICRQDTYHTPAWVKDMVGEVKVVAQTGALLLKRFVPEPLAYGAFTPDNRVQFCSIADQTEQGDNPTPESEFQEFGSKWPYTKWQKFRTVFEAFPFAILDEVPIFRLPAMGDIAAGAGAFAGARELYRYVVRKKKTYTKEMTVPGPNVGGGVGFHVIDAARKPVPGGFAFHVMSYASCSLKWVRVPVGWPPPPGHVPPDPANPWPPVFNPVAAGPATTARTRDTFAGTINSDWFDCAAPDGWCCPPGTLIYHGYDDSNKYYDAAGQWVCDVEFFFTFRGIADATGTIRGWNHYLNSSSVWVEVSSDVVPGDNTHGTVGGRRPYKTNDFNDLFRWRA